MKTWEMIEKLAENRELRFVCDEQPDNPIGIIGRTLCWLRDEEPMQLNFKSFMNVGTIDNYNWEPVRKAVDFMTVINSGKKIKYENWANYYEVCNAISILIDRPADAICTMINGKWFIE